MMNEDIVLFHLDYAISQLDQHIDDIPYYVYSSLRRCSIDIIQRFIKLGWKITSDMSNNASRLWKNRYFESIYLKNMMYYQTMSVH